MTQSKGKNDTPDAPESAWKKDLEIGNILGQVFSPEGEGSVFLLIAGQLTGETIATKYGNVEQAAMLVRKLDAEHRPVGPAFKVTTVESAIVAKIAALVDDDTPCIVRYHTVASKQRGGEAAKVLSYVAKPGESDAELFDEFGVTANALTDDLAGFGLPG